MEGTSNERGKGKECYWVAEEQLMEMVMPQREVVPHEPSLSNMLFNVDPEWVSGTVVCIEAMPEILGPKVQSFLESNLNLKSQKSRVVLDGVNVVHGKGVVGCDVDGKNEKTSGGSVMEVGPAKCNGSGGEEIALRDVGGADVSTHRVEEAVDDCSYGDSVGDGSLEGDDGSSEGGVGSPVGEINVKLRSATILNCMKKIVRLIKVWKKRRWQQGRGLLCVMIIAQRVASLFNKELC